MSFYKSTALTLATLGLFGLTLAPPTVKAGDHEWATAGKILTGVVGYQLISGAVARSDRGSYRQETYYSPRHYEAPRRVEYYSYREPERRVVYTNYYTPRSNVTYYEERTPEPRVIYVPSPAPAPQPQIVVIQQPAPAPQPQIVVQQQEAQPQAAQAQATTQAQSQVAQANPTGNDVDKDRWVMSMLEDGKRLVQPRVRGAAATMQMWSDVHKQWVDIKEYPSIY